MPRRPRRSPSPRDSDRPLPAVQERSQATLDRLLAAAEELLREGGFEAATLRAIAERAGVSVGIVYRRFPDKDAVLRSVYVRYFERAGAANARNLNLDTLRKLSLRDLSNSLISGMATGYRTNRPMLRSLLLYAHTHDDPEFRRLADALNAATFDQVGALFLARRAEMKHEDAETAVRFALVSASATLQSQILFKEPSSGSGVAADVLVRETTRAFRSYLGIAP